jgi:hypothetical protein
LVKALKEKKGALKTKGGYLKARKPKASPLN